MWKPGASPPVSGKNSKKKKKSKTNEESSPLQGSGSILAGVTSQESKATPKRLSGATMNMRFMKRKQETLDQERERKRMSLERTQASAAAASQTTILSPPSVPPRIAAPMASRGGERQKSDNDMDTDDTDDDNDDDDRTTPTKKTTTEAYQVATPIDMYGMQAALLGRRSFGSFNPAIEEAWKESKASLELDSSLDRRNKQQATDEELIKRYQEIVKKRSESARTVGNLGEKSKPKKQIR